MQLEKKKSTKLLLYQRYFQATALCLTFRLGESLVVTQTKVIFYEQLFFEVLVLVKAKLKIETLLAHSLTI